MIVPLAALVALVLTTPQDPRPEQIVEVTSFRTIIESVAWDSTSKGSFVTVCPPKQQRERSIDALGLKLVRMGEVSSYVPRQMTLINTRFPKEPNLYEGLPMGTKILYLMTLLQPDQWKLAGGDGISLADCRGEQRAVMEAILPRPFRYKRGIAESDSFGSASDGGETEEVLSDDERSQVRLKLRRQVELKIPLAEGNGHGYAYAFRDFADRQEAADVDPERNQRFGHQLFVSSENRLRPSHLDLSDPIFDAEITFQANESVGALIGRIGEQVGRELYAAPAFARYQLVTHGQGGTARDVLKCILLGCTGVFRKVGPAYELTNDLEGMAAHNAKLSAWQTDLENIAREREMEWRSQIKTTSGISYVPLAGNALQKLTPAELANLKENDRGSSALKYVSIDGGNPTIRRVVQERNDPIYENEFDTSRVAISSQFKWTLSLPNGLESWGPSFLGNTAEFGKAPTGIWQPEPTQPVELPMKPPSGLLAIATQASKPEEAETQVRMASRLGLKELWVETDSVTSLKRAIATGKEMGVGIRLVIRPWAGGPSVTPAEVDRNVTGTFGAELDEVEHSFLAVQRYYTEEMRYPRARRVAFAPSEPGAKARIAQLKALTQTPNLTGVSILDAYPRGYHTERENINYGSYSFTLRDLFDLGFSDGQRLEFLRKHKVDPLDLCPDRGQGLFSEKVWGGEFGGFQEEASEKWQKAKAFWAKRAVDDLLASLYDAQVPVLVGAQPAGPPRIDPPEALYSWNPGLGHLALPSVPAPSAMLLNIIDDENPDRRVRVANSLVRLLKSAKAPVILDLTEVQPARVSRVLSGWLTHPSPD